MDQEIVLSLADLARRLGAQVIGDAAGVVSGIAPLEVAGRGDLSFLANPRYLEQARRTSAAAVLVGPGVELAGKTMVVVADPYLALARALEIFHPVRRPVPGISPGAMIGSECSFGPGAAVLPGAIVGDGCRVGARSAIQSGAVLGARVQVGEDVTVHPNVTIYDGCVLGDRVIVHAGAVIGSDGFGFARESERYHKIPQVGNVVIEDDVEIGANVAVDRATFGSTVIGRGTKIDNLVQIGHNVQIGENSVLVAQVGISGSTRLGKDVVFAGQSGAVGHITIGDGARVGAKSAVTRDVASGEFVIGHPAIDARTWKRAAAVFARLPDMWRRLLRLERGPSEPGERSDEKEA